MTSKYTVQWTPAHGPSRKLVFEPQPEGDYSWARIEFELCESQWREVGIEYLEEVSFVSDERTELTLPRVQTHPEGGDADE